MQAGSRFLSPAESRYAVIELELLAVTWGVIKCKMFLSALQHFQLVTDHNPLVPILNSHRLDEIENPRLQRLCTKLMAYNFTAVWCKGKTNTAPDALSRHPVLEPSRGDALAEQDEDHSPAPSIAEIRAHQADNSLDSTRLQDLRKYAAEDDEYQQLKTVILRGFPDHRSDLPDSCKQYWQVRHSLTIDDNLIVYGCRLLVPTRMRRDMLSQLHESHQGMVRTKQRARLTIYWPGLDNDIDNLVSQCKQCQTHLPSHPKEPLINKPRPTRPFQKIAADFCHHAGRSYLVFADCFTDWPTIVPMGYSATSADLITAARELFSRTAVPDVFWSDGGPQFTSKQFQQFSTQWGFNHQVSSPHYPQSNGKAEATVKAMKKIIRAAWNGRFLDDDKLCMALLQYRNTPSSRDGLSPAQKLFGHPMQDMLPAHSRSFAPEWQHSTEDTEKKAINTEQAAKRYYDRTVHPLSDIQQGSQVVLQNPTTKLWDMYGVVISVEPHRRYRVRIKSGKVLIRNRRFLRRRTPVLNPQHRVTPVNTGSAMPPASRSSPNSPTQEPPPRRSSRTTRRPQRLVEDPTWN